MDNFQSAAAEGGGDCGHYRSDGRSGAGRTGRAIHSAASSPPSLALEHTAHDDIHFAKMHLVHLQLECGLPHSYQRH